MILKKLTLFTCLCSIQCFAHDVARPTKNCIHFLDPTNSWDNTFLNAHDPQIVDASSLARSHLSEEEIGEILELNRKKLFIDRMKNVYTYISRITWDLDVDPVIYKNPFEKKLLIVRDLLVQVNKDNNGFRFIQGDMPNGDVFFLGNQSNFIYLEKSTNKFFKGKVFSEATPESIEDAEKTEIVVQ